jgi:hypothetical protein
MIVKPLATTAEETQLHGNFIIHIHTSHHSMQNLNPSNNMHTTTRGQNTWNTARNPENNLGYFSYELHHIRAQLVFKNLGTKNL